MRRLVCFYTSLFADSGIVAINRHTDANPDQAGAVTLVTFKLAGQEFRALNGGPQYEFNEAVSLFVECETQREDRRALEQALRR